MNKKIAIILEGPDKVGKTTLLSKIKSDNEAIYLKFPDRDDEFVKEALSDDSEFDERLRQHVIANNCFRQLLQLIDLKVENNVYLFDRFPSISSKVYFNHGEVPHVTAISHDILFKVLKFDEVHLIILAPTEPLLAADEREFYEKDWNEIRDRYASFTALDVKKLYNMTLHKFTDEPLTAIFEASYVIENLLKENK